MRFVAAWTLTSLMIAGLTAQAAPLSYTGGVYTQNFDGLPLSDGILPPVVTIPLRGPHDINGQLGTTGLAGWTMSNFAGSSANTEFRAHDGSLAGSNGRGIVSFGTDNSSERALGALATSNQISHFGLSLVNDTGAPLTKIDIAFTGEQWRRGNVPTPPATVPNQMLFSYAITNDPLHNINTGAPVADPAGPQIFSGVPALTYTSPNTQAAPTEVPLDGNAAANQVALSHTIGGINWAPGSTLILRWANPDISGQDDGLSIDNLRVTPGVPEPATAIFAGIATMSMALLRRRHSVN